MTSQIVWKAFLKGGSAIEQTLLEEALSDEVKQELSSLPTLPLLQFKTTSSWQEELHKIHYSWFCPFLRALPEKEIKLFLATLSSEQIKGIKQALLLSPSVPNVPVIGMEYLQGALWKLIGEAELLPASLIPPSPLCVLFRLSCEELYGLIDLLAMYDLSSEIRHIIDTAKLKEIHDLLSQSQQAFLKTLVHQKETVSFKKIGLSNWDKDREVLQALLEQRGINRLAKALYPCHPSLRWYIAHRLDIEKGQMLLKLSTPLSHEKAYPILTDHILALVELIQRNIVEES